jgi:hypothetical protein
MRACASLAMILLTVKSLADQLTAMRLFTLTPRRLVRADSLLLLLLPETDPALDSRFVMLSLLA